MRAGRRRARGVALPILLLCASICLGGCWHIAGVQMMGLVSMIAIDAAPGGGYEVSAAFLNIPGLPPPGPAAGGGRGQSPVYLRSASAPGLDEALHLLAQHSYLDMDLTHLQAVLVSEAVARSGLAAPMQYLASSRAATHTGWLLVVRRGSARHLLEATQKDLPQPNEVLTETIGYDRYSSPYYAARLFTFFREAPLQGTEFATAGVLAGTAAGPATTTPFQIKGEALFRGPRLVGWLDGGAALGWVVAMGHLRRQTLAVATASGRGDLVLVRANHRVRVLPDGAGLPRVVLNLQVTGQLTDATTDLWTDPASLADFEAAAARVLEGDVNDAIRRAQAVGADVFGLGNEVRIQDPAYWSHLRVNWSAAAFPHLPVAVRVRVTISAVGATLCPLTGGC